MARGAAASSQKDSQDGPADGDSKASKRRCVQSACVPCRKRKSKCDGGTPVCATCTAVYKTDCFYDPESENRRTKTGSSSAASAGTKRDASVVVSSSNSSNIATSAEFIINSLRKLPEEHIHEFVSHIRKDPKLDIASLAESWRKTVTLPPSTPFEVQSLESDLSVLLGKPAVTLTGQSRHFGHSASLGLVPEEENFGGDDARTNSVYIERRGTTWTSVTQDLAFVERLFALYFTWSHPFFVLFSRECFYKDFRAGRDKYCSPLLVNAICAYACHLTNEPAGRTDPSNFRTAGDHFFAEARRLLFENETPSLTTTQALCVMSMREPSTGRDSSGFGYIGRCMHMCVELGLHLNNSASPALRLTPSEVEVRKVTFWGCFSVDTAWSVCTGRIAQLPRAAITLDKPILEELAGLPESFPGASRAQSSVVTTRMFLQEFSTLSELVNDNNYMFFAPKERLTSTRLLECYSKYKAWYRKLPAALAIEGKKQPEPHTLVLHMFYHTIIVHLFRPMLKVDLIHSDVRPREICIEAANNVSSIVRIYRKLYDFRVAHLLIPHCLLSVCIVHLLYSKDNRISYQNLVDGLQGLEDVHECHYFGARSFRIIHTLAKTWDLPWPEELRNAKLIPQSNPDKPQGTLSPPADPLLVVPNTIPTTGHRAGPNMPYSPIGHPDRRESLSMFAPQGSLQLATHPAIPRPGSVPAAQHRQSPIVGQTPTQSYASSISMSPYQQYSQPMSSVPLQVSTTATSPTNTVDTLFWNPIPGMPGPIIPRTYSQQISPMGLDSVLQSNDMGDRLGRDGFKMSEDWQSSHVNGFATGGSNNGFSTQQTSQATGAGAYLQQHRVGAGFAPQEYQPQQQQQQQPQPQQQPQQQQQQHSGQHEEYDGGWYPGDLS